MLVRMKHIHIKISSDQRVMFSIARITPNSRTRDGQSTHFLTHTITTEFHFVNSISPGRQVLSNHGSRAP
jgi:hypothetical protein